jgi:glycosyltransferase involved in cell wall biosynthesis
MNRVAFAEGYYNNFAGAQQSMMYLLENLSAVHPIMITPNSGDLNDIAARRGIETTVVQTPSSLDKFGGELLNGSAFDYMRQTVSFVRYQFTIAQYLRNADIDLLYCNNPRSTLFFAPVANMLDIPVVWYVRNDAKGGYSGPPWIDKITIRLADHLICISDGVRDRFKNHRVNSSKLTTINTGVDVSEFNPDNEYNPIKSLSGKGKSIVQVGSIHPRKGQDLLVDAMGHIASDVGEFTLAFAGNVSEDQVEYKQRLKDRVDNIGISDNVIFLGWCDNIPALLDQTDIFVLPSHNEGLPRSVLEAMAMEVPTVATPAGGTEELVQDNKTGLIVPMDDTESLASAIYELCSNPDERVRMGQNARKLAIQEYSVETYINDFEQFLQSII